MDEAFPVCPTRSGTASLGRAETRATVRKPSALRVYCHLMPGSPDGMRQAINRAFSESPDCPEIAPEGKTGL
jgi:hypothetical protein